MLAEGNHGFGPGGTHWAQALLHQLEEMVVVVSLDTYHQVVGTGHKMAFGHFGNFRQGLHHLVEIGIGSQVQPYIGKSVVSQRLGGYVA